MMGVYQKNRPYDIWPRLHFRKLTKTKKVLESYSRKFVEGKDYVKMFIKRYLK